MKHLLKKATFAVLLLIAATAVSFSGAAILYQNDMAAVKNREFNCKSLSAVESGIELRTKLIFDDGITYSGAKFNYAGQHYAVEKIETQSPDGGQALSFCPDFASISIEGQYRFARTERDITAQQKQLMIAAFDYINDRYGLESITSGRLLGQLVVWNILLGDTGYYMESTERTLVKFEGADSWYTAEFASLVDGILSGTIDVISIYNAKRSHNATAGYISDILCIADSYHQRQIIPVNKAP